MTLPRMAILALRVTLAITAASMLTAGFMHQYEAWCSLDMMPSNPVVIGPGVLLVVLVVEDVGLLGVEVRVGEVQAPRLVL